MKTAASSPQTDLRNPTLAAGEAVALNVEGGSAPEWIELIPAGEVITGFDNRSWTNPDPQAVVDATPVGVRPLVIDFEHATQVRGEQGLDAPAAAWVDTLEVRDGAIWGRVSDWTARARQMVEAKEYRLISPVFGFTPDTRRITRLISAALTNFPNLSLTALNREDRQGLHREQETPLTLAERLAAALGLAAAATDDQIVTAATEAVARNRAGPDLSSFAPRADLDAALNRATTAEASLKVMREADQTRAVDAAISAAMDAGKVVPASEETYRALCREEGGLERFNALVATLPVIAGAAETRAANRVEEKTSGASSLTEEERAVCRQLGQSEESFAKGKAGGN